jgi:hypothetical protein
LAQARQAVFHLSYIGEANAALLILHRANGLILCEGLQECAHFIEGARVCVRCGIGQLFIGAEGAFQQVLCALNGLCYRADILKRELPRAVFLQFKAE